MIRFSKIWYWIVIVVVVIVAAGLTTLFAQKNDVPISEEANPSDNTNKDDTATKVELQPEDPALHGTTVDVDSTTKVEFQQLFNDLRKEYLDTRAASVEWWLTFVTIIIGLLALFLALLGFLGLQEFKRLKAEAKEDADEIKGHLTEVLKRMAELDRVTTKAESDEMGTESDEAIQRTRETLSAEVFATLSGDQEFESVLRDFDRIPNLSFVDKAMVDAYKLQKDGRIKEAIQKWRSVANIVGETDKDLAARAWSSVGYLLSESELVEKAVSAYDKAIEMKADYAHAYYNRGVQRINLEQYLPAMEDFDRAIKLNLDKANVYVGRGIARLELGKRDDAFIDLNNAISIEPDYASAYAVRGEAKVSENDIAGAKSDFQRALDLAEKQGKRELEIAIVERLRELNEIE